MIYYTFYSLFVENEFLVSNWGVLLHFLLIGLPAVVVAVHIAVEKGSITIFNLPESLFCLDLAPFVVTCVICLGVFAAPFAAPNINP